MTKYNYRFVIKKDIGMKWENSTYIPLEGEPCYDTTNKIFKIGNGLNTFPNLDAISGGLDQSILNEYILSSEKSTANGLATLGDDRKIPLDQLKIINDLYSNSTHTYSSEKINSLLVSGVSFKGHWDPASNVPEIVQGTGKNGDFYIVSASGVFGVAQDSILFKEGDVIIYSEDTGLWERSINSNTVDSVNGQTGEVVLSIDDIDGISISGSSVGESLVYNGTEWTNTPTNIALNSIDDVDTWSHTPQVGESLVYDGGNWVPQKVEIPSELEKITENGNNGWALLGVDRVHRSAIGEGSIDLSADIYSSSLCGTSGASGSYSIVTGKKVSASGIASFASGYDTCAIGMASHTEGMKTQSSGYTSHAEGYSTTASGDNSHAEGKNTLAEGYISHAEGKNTKALGDMGSHAEGNLTEANSNGSHAEGYKTIASGDYSHAEGIGTIARNSGSHTAGKYNIGTSNDTVHETGIGYMASGYASRKNAFEIYTDGRLVAPELTPTLINTPRSLITKEYLEANSNPAGEDSQLALVTENSKTGWRLFGADDTKYGEIGVNAIDLSMQTNTSGGATGNNSFAVGYNNIASGDYSVAMGNGTTASGTASMSMGYLAEATGEFSLAVGNTTHAEGYSSTAIGYVTTASGNHGSFSQGRNTTASGDSSHAEGNNTTSSGNNSHAEGSYAYAIGIASHAEGYNTKAINDNMHVAGSYNVGTSTDTIHETGIGLASNDRRNAFEIYKDGTLTAPQSTNALIDARGDKSLVTKEYVDSFTPTDPIEHDFASTAAQSIFTIIGKTLTYVGVFVNGIKVKSDRYTISIQGSDTEVAFVSSLNENDWVQLLEY